MRRMIMNWNQPIYQDIVHADWVDYNGHMNDAAYAFVFSQSVEKLMQAIGIDERFITEEQYTIYTLETHLVYIKEVLENESFTVHVQLIKHDHKRLHVFFVMYSDAGDRLATSEQMLMGIDQKIRRSAPFPETIYQNIVQLQKHSDEQVKPPEIGRSIGFT